MDQPINVDTVREARDLHAARSAGPFRAPHHTASERAYRGTAVDHGSLIDVRPGELALANGGTLHLDELAEYPRIVIETIARAYRDGYVDVRLGRRHVRLPAAFRITYTDPLADDASDQRRAKRIADALALFSAPTSPAN